MSQRILVIEGDPVLRDSMWRLLSDHGHQVELAANGAQAAERSLSTCFDTLIWDVSLIDIGAGFLTRLLGAGGARVPAPSLIVLVEHCHLLEMSRVCGGFSKPFFQSPFGLRSCSMRYRAPAASLRRWALRYRCSARAAITGNRRLLRAIYQPRNGDAMACICAPGFLPVPGRRLIRKKP